MDRCHRTCHAILFCSCRGHINWNADFADAIYRRQSGVGVATLGTVSVAIYFGRLFVLLESSIDAQGGILVATSSSSLVTANGYFCDVKEFNMDSIFLCLHMGSFIFDFLAERSIGLCIRNVFIGCFRSLAAFWCEN